MVSGFRVNLRLLPAALFALSLAAQGVDAPKPGGLAGVVFESKSGAPVPKATVILRGKQDAGIGSTTSASGVFTFRDLEPGVYQIIVERTGYVIAPESQRKTVTVKAGETVSDFKLTMLRAGVISGRVLDTDGEPLALASIQVSPQRKGARGKTGVTNDLGEYRVFDVVPGKYRIAASYTANLTQPATRMQTEPGPDGRVVHEAYPTLYYPGAVDAAQAIALNVEPGADLRGIDFHMVRTPAVRVSGRVTGPAGLFISISLQPLEKGAGGEGRLANATQKGEFELPDVLRGAYWLTAVSSGLDAGSLLSARRMIQVGDQDVEGIQLALGAGQTLTGRLIAPEGRQLPPRLVIDLQSRDDKQGAGAFAQVAPDGAFSLRSIGPGDYDAVLGSTQASDDDLYISTMRMGDTDALADGVHIAEAAPEPLNIVFKSNGASVACVVKDDKGAPIPAAHVLLVPAAPKTGRFALHGECTAAADGTCRISGITPGDYHAYALVGDTQVDHRDPDLLKSIESDGKAITLAEGQQEKIELTATPAE